MALKVMGKSLAMNGWSLQGCLAKIRIIADWVSGTCWEAAWRLLGRLSLEEIRAPGGYLHRAGDLPANPKGSQRRI